MELEISETKYFISKVKVKGLSAQIKLININPIKIQKGKIYEKVPLISPIDGYIEKIDVKIGQYVESNKYFINVIDIDKIHADLMVFEKDIDKVKLKQKLSLYIQSSKRKDFTGNIIALGKVF